MQQSTILSQRQAAAFKPAKQVGANPQRLFCDGSPQALTCAPAAWVGCSL